MFKLAVIYLFLHMLIVDSQATHIQKESIIKRESMKKKSRASGEMIHEVIFAIKQNNLDTLDAMLLERSTPGSPTYQQWMTFEEIGDYISNPDSANAVKNWLGTNGITTHWESPRKEYLKAKASIAKWEELFAAEFFEWEDDKMHEDAKHFIRSEDYSLPDHVHPHIEAVFNTVQAPPHLRKKFYRKDETATTAMKSNLRSKVGENEQSDIAEDITVSLESDTAAPQSYVTVAFLSKLYGISSNIGSTNLKQSVFETASQGYSTTDLSSFQKYYGLTAQSAVNIGGHRTTECGTISNYGYPYYYYGYGYSINKPYGCGEGNLDIQYIMGIAQKTISIYWYVNPNQGDPFVAWLVDISGATDPPTSNSISWVSDHYSCFNLFIRKINSFLGHLFSFH